MPPKGKAPKLHVLAAEIPAGFKFSDTNKKEFVLGKQFATGGFGRIYTCNEAGKKEQLCVKVEPAGNGPLFVEIAVFQRALKLDMIQAYCKDKTIKTVGLPHMISGGIFDYKEDKMRFLIMPKYAGSLESVREKTGRLDEVAALTVAKACVRSLDYLASKNYTHGDIKSMNILLPSPTDFEGAVLVDFGLARMASSNVEKADKKRAHNGTAIFTSLDAHRGFQPSYRGDVEILVYNIVYWISGKLPWQPKESNPAAVQAEKETWEKSAEKEIERLIGAPIGGPVAKIYRLAQKTPYTEYADTAAVLKLLDQALAACKKPSTSKKAESTPKVETKPSKSKRVVVKKAVKEDSDEEEEEIVPKKIPASKRVVTKKVVKEESDEKEEEIIPNKIPASKRVAAQKKAVAKEESDEKEEEVIPKSTSRRMRKPAIESEDSAEEPTPVKPQPVKRVAPVVPKRAESEVAKSSGAAPSQEDRARKRTVSVDPPGLLNSPTRRPSDAKQSRRAIPVIVPGLANSIVKKEVTKIVEESEGDEEDEEDGGERSDQSEEEIQIPKGVGSAVKRDKEELRRTVPGMRNLQKGRRSEIISQIASKYKK